MDPVARFRRAVLVALYATLFLVGVGSLVRASGSGLGCPDWPHCFGSWIPPISADQLPPEFDKSKFNVWQTWTEYINRLIGVIVGFLILWAAIRSLSVRRTHMAAFCAAIAALLLVAFQGWLGGAVVQSELQPWLITAHMLTALAIVMLLIYAWFATLPAEHWAETPETDRRKVFNAGSAVFITLVTQIAIGTQVREKIDEITNQTPDLPRSEWVERIHPIFAVHGAFAWGVVLLSVILLYIAFRSETGGLVRRLALGCPLLLLFQMATGAGLSLLAIPPVLQILHLTVAVLAASGLFLLLLLTGAQPASQYHGAPGGETEDAPARL
jgi:cytochrome c oxidase assembly protein subunit 15